MRIIRKLGSNLTLWVLTTFMMKNMRRLRRAFSPRLRVAQRVARSSQAMVILYCKIPKNKYVLALSKVLGLLPRCGVHVGPRTTKAVQTSYRL